MKPENKYRAFGLNILSSIQLPELAAASFSSADVIIEIGENPKTLDGAQGKGVLFQAKENDFLFHLDTVGSFRVQNGEKICVERLNNASDDELRLFLLGSAMGALIQQRGALPIHGSSVYYKNRGIIFSGQSGVGKSSIVEALTSRGATLIADDISVINFKEDKPFIEPGIPFVKLWKDVIDHLNYDDKELKKVRPELLKFRKKADKFDASALIRADVIVIIHPHNSSEITHNLIVGANKIQSLKNNVYRYQFASGLNKKTLHFSLLSKLASQCKVIELRRPSSPLQLEKLANYIETCIEIYPKND